MEIHDFRELAAALFNEFIPTELSENVKVVDGMGIAYFKSERLMERRTEAIRFMLERALSSSGNGCVFVQEPRPVNNVRLQPFLSHLETCPFIDDEKRTRILHLANKRYVPRSEIVFFSDDVQIDAFLNQAFMVMSKLNPSGVKFHRSESLCFDDVVSAAEDVFPRKSLSICRFNDEADRSVDIISTNLVVKKISSQMVAASSGEHAGLSSQKSERYLRRCMESERQALLNLV